LTAGNANQETYSFQIGNGATKVRLLSQGSAAVAGSQNGDIWFDGANMKFKINDTEYTVTAT